MNCDFKNYFCYDYYYNCLAGKVISNFPHRQFVTCVQYHPTDGNLFLAGTSRNGIYCWDTRLQKVQYKLLIITINHSILKLCLPTVLSEATSDVCIIRYDHGQIYAFAIIFLRSAKNL